MEKSTLSKENVRSEEEAIEIFDFWNGLGLVKHKNKGVSYEKYIKILMRVDMDINVIKKAMINYKEILDSDFFYSYINNIDKFVAYKIDNFTDEGYQWKNYLLFKENSKKEVEDVQVNNFRIDGYTELIHKLKYMPYKEYLLTSHWKHFSNEAFKFFGACVVCGTTKNLKIHHKTYQNRGRETFLDVVCLCGECHAKFHGKEE